MAASFSKLSNIDIKTLADALRSGRLIAPFTKTAVARTNISRIDVDDVVGSLEMLSEQSFDEQQISTLLMAVYDERVSIRKLDELLSLVITGPEAPGTRLRDTGVVVRDMFRNAKCSVTLIGYSVYQGQQVFSELAQRMEDVPSLTVNMYLNLPPRKDTEQVLQGI